MTVESYDPNKDNGYVCSVTLNFEIRPSVTVMTQSFNHVQHLFEISFNSNITVNIHIPDQDCGFLCIVTLKIWPWFKIMTHHLVIDDNCGILSKSNIAVGSNRSHKASGTTDRRTDGQTDGLGDSSISPYFVAGVKYSYVSVYPWTSHYWGACVTEIRKFK